MKYRPLYWLGWLATRCITGLFWRILVTGQENVPKTGGFILAVNHRSYLDPPIVGSWSPRVMVFFAKAELFRVWGLGWAIRNMNAIPVKRGTIDRAAIERAVEIIRGGFGLVVFPEGTRCRTDGFLEPKAGIGVLARAAGCPVVPAYLEGTNQFASAILRKPRLSLTFGSWIDPEWIGALPEGREGYETLANEVMNRIRQLAEGVAGRQIAGRSQ